ncbi:hypothetical protein GCM10008107_19940 [Psychrosphaera saromensis]|uniref:hypothetical protein n=1 Tax=Psychrosphaera saromensis TaxID=716813 RepID=UPI001675815E|nr:hypothetical protein [Psychrosphaera saromensis]GHB70519.1 hypothetical protein GCM10008107_19940 [Psychrosphaera saromensis]
MNNKSIFNLSIIELIIVLFAMFMVITVYQLSYKTEHINELNKVVESQREITEDVVSKNYPVLENKIHDLVNLEKYKKLNNQLKNNNSGTIFIENKIINNVINADKQKDYGNYKDLLKNKTQLYGQLKDLQNHTLTVGTLKNLQLENKPLHQQIQSLEKRIKSNYQNRMALTNKLQQLKGNETVKYILQKLDVHDAPIQKQLDTLNGELKRFDNSLLDKNYKLATDYDDNTKDILQKLDQKNRPIDKQIELLEQTLKNKKLLLEIKRLENKLANIPKNSKYSLERKELDSKEFNRKLNELKKQLSENRVSKNPRLQKAINNLNRIQTNNQRKYESNTKDMLNRLEQGKLPLSKQIENLQKELDTVSRNSKLQKALDNLNTIKINNQANYDPNTKELLKQLKQDKRPLAKQIENLEKELDTVSRNSKLQKALNNLNTIETDNRANYDPTTKELLKQLNQDKQPLAKQIENLEKELDTVSRNSKLKEALDNLNTIETDNQANYDQTTKELLKQLNQDKQPLAKQIENLQKELDAVSRNSKLKEALDNLNKIKTDNQANYDQTTKELLKQLKQDKQPLAKQIENLQKELDAVSRNSKLKEALDNLNKIKTDNQANYDPITKELLKQLNQDKQPLDTQIEGLKTELEKASKNPDINTEKLQKALDNLNKIKTDSQSNYDPITEELLKQLNQDNEPLAKQIEGLKTELEKASKNPDINDEKLQKALDNLNKIKTDSQSNYDPITKELLKQLNQDKQPLDQQIEGLKTELEKASKNPDINTEKLQKALDNLNKIKTDNQANYDPITEELLKQLNQDKQPLDQQIEGLKTELEKASKNPDINTEKLQQAIDNLNSIKTDNQADYDPITKELLKQLKQDKEPLAKQIEALKNAQENEFKNQDINDENLQKALDNLQKIKNKPSQNINYVEDPAYVDQLKDVLDGINRIKVIKDELANNKDSKPIINKNIEETIKYLEDKNKDPRLKPNDDVQVILNEFNIKDKATPEQLSNLYLNLYSAPIDDVNVSELNFVINRLKDQSDLENQVKYINDTLEKYNNTFAKGNDTEKDSNIASNKELEGLRNKIKYLQKKVEKNGTVHLPCMLDDTGTAIYIFKLFLRDDNIHVQLGWQEQVAQLSKDIPNLDKLVDQTLTLNRFMELTKPIFKQSIQNECRQFVYLEDETISKKEYKRKTLTIQHHFYKYIDHAW